MCLHCSRLFTKEDLKNALAEHTNEKSSFKKGLHGMQKIETS